MHLLFERGVMTSVTVCRVIQRSVILDVDNDDDEAAFLLFPSTMPIDRSPSFSSTL